MMEENVVEILLKLADLMESDRPNTMIELTVTRRKLIADALRCYAEEITSQEKADAPQRPQ